MTIHPAPKPRRKSRATNTWNGLPRPSKPPKSVNRKRKASEFARCYGSKERVELVKSLPCAACGKAGRSENAHVASGGKGRKADASQVVPLCGRWKFSPNDRTYFMGCHAQMHQQGRRALEQQWGVDLDAAARKTELAWQAFKGDHA